MIVGLSGLAQAGKDTTGTILETNYGFTRVAFADKMKEFAYRLNPIVWDDGPITDKRTPKVLVRLAELVDELGWDEAKQIADVRQLLQRLGTDAGRHVFGDDVWTRAALLGRDIITEDVVVTDVRFPDEATYIKSLLGVVVRIVRPGLTPPNDHISEHAMAGWRYDAIIMNDGGYGDLKAVVHDFVVDLTARAAS